MRLKFSAGWLLILVFTIITFILWWSQAAVASSWYVFTNIGQLLGLTGMTWFAITLTLNTRWKFLEELFHGLDRLYFAHHMMGALTLIVLLFHPISLVVSYLAISLNAAAKFLIPALEIPTNMGRIALLSMVIFLVLTFFIKLPYHIWKFTHQFLGVSFMFASLHVLTISSDVSYNMPLRYYMYFLISLGLYAYAYRMLLHRFLLPKYWYTIYSTKNLNGEVNEIELVPDKKNITFTPGQFVFIRYKNRKVGNEQHPFSITSKVGSSTLKLAIKNLGDFTSKLPLLKKGDKAVIEGPYGKFAKDAYKKPSVWIAGGIGITPFLSLARSYKGQNKIFLFYSVKENHEFIYKQELDSISKNYQNFKVIYWNSTESGHLTAVEIKKTVGDVNKYSYYLCGPWRMMMAIKKELVSLKINPDLIDYEEFELV